MMVTETTRTGEKVLWTKQQKYQNASSSWLYLYIHQDDHHHKDIRTSSQSPPVSSCSSANLPRARTQIISLFGALSSTRGEAIDSANLVTLVHVITTPTPTPIQTTTTIVTWQTQEQEQIMIPPQHHNNNNNNTQFDLTWQQQERKPFVGVPHYPQQRPQGGRWFRS